MSENNILFQMECYFPVVGPVTQLETKNCLRKNEGKAVTK